jgi:hypothetical protein
MKHCLKIILPVMLAALGRGAPVACPVGPNTYASYQALGATGCIVGNEVFSNFTALSFSNSLNIPNIPTSDILITPSTAAGVDSLLFSYTSLPVVAGIQTATVVGVGNNQILGYNFFFTVTPNPNPLTNIQMTSTISNTNTASVSAVKDASNGGPTVNSSANDGGAPHAALTLVTGPVTALSGAGAFTVEDVISLQGQNGVAQQSNFTNLFTEGPFSSTTPEPGPVLLIGSGLVCLGLTRRRFRQK